MIYAKEVIHHPKGKDKRQISERILSARPFREAQIKQGGYGILEEDFWLQRVRERGFHAIVLTLSGEGRVTFEDGTSIHVKKGDAYVSWSTGQGHREETIGPEPWEMIWFTVWDTSKYFIPDTKDWYLRHFEDTDTIRQIWLSVFAEGLNSDPLAKDALEMWESLFLINIKRIFGWTEDVGDSRHRQAFQKLWEKVMMRMDLPWTLDDMASELGLSKSHVSRICHELYGKSPGEMITDLKMQEARMQLINSDKSISEVAEHIGYIRLSTFSYAFKEYWGLTPREYRMKEPPENKGGVGENYIATEMR